MSAGRGVRHSEFNHADGQTTHFLQIWIEPNQLGITPGYEQKSFSRQQKQGRLCLLASSDGAEGSVKIHADAAIYGGLLCGQDNVKLALESKRKAYVHVVSGTVNVNGETLQSGDAAKIDHESELTLDQAQDAEVLVFDLAAH